ncbi:MAG: hypothetical protein QNJ88_06895 [Acidimicrobiia bacterium]|nr:hypothetical protein [Acidimicrobiia bacterium]
MLPLPRQRLGRRFTQLLIGLVVFGFGIALMVVSDLGLSPWQTLHQGVAERTGLAIGTVTILTGIVVLLLWIPLGERIGLGTILNVAIIGNALNRSLDLLPEEFASLPIRWLAMLSGVCLIGLGTSLYIGVRMGSGPRDGVMTGLARRGINIGVVRTGIEVTVLAIGWSLGGTVGFGTIAFAAGIGPIIAYLLPKLTVMPIVPVASSE